jgi:hypothetical protein
MRRGERLARFAGQAFFSSAIANISALKDYNTISLTGRFLPVVEFYCTDTLSIQKMQRFATGNGMNGSSNPSVLPIPADARIYLRPPIDTDTSRNLIKGKGISSG